MRFGEQGNAVFFGRVGTRVTYAFDWPPTHLKAQAPYNRHFLDSNRTVTGALMSAPVSFDPRRRKFT